MAKQRRTSKKAGKAASKVLRDKRTGKASKTVAGSALSQRAPKKKKRKQHKICLVLWQRKFELKLVRGRQV